MIISEALKSDLLSGMDVEKVFQKHVIDGNSYFFRDVLLDINKEYSMRHDIAKKLNVNINDVVIVGSSKVGFSLKTKDFLPFDHKYGETSLRRDRSDIDVAVVNRKLFDESAEIVFDVSNHFDKDWVCENWRVNLYNTEPKNLFVKYAIYVAKGWLRPDFMPNIFLNDSGWADVCNFWRADLQRKVSIGVYSDWNYLKCYHVDNLCRLRSDLSDLKLGVF